MRAYAPRPILRRTALTICALPPPSTNHSTLTAPLYYTPLSLNSQAYETRADFSRQRASLVGISSRMQGVICEHWHSSSCGIPSSPFLSSSSLHSPPSSFSLVHVLRTCCSLKHIPAQLCTDHSIAQMPGINQVIGMIKSRRRRDAIILGVVIGLCFIGLVSYVWSW